jgi:hypothetical protein
MNEIYEQIQLLSEEHTNFADPNKVLDLPFPSTNVIPARFSCSNEGCLFVHGTKGFP